MNEKKSKENRFLYNVPEWIQRIVSKCLMHDASDFISIDQKSIADSLEKHMDQIQKTIRWMYALALLFIISPDVKMFGLDIVNKDGICNIFNVTLVIFVFGHLSILVCLIRIGKLIQHFNNEEDYNLGLSKLSTHTLIPNPFVFVGSKNHREQEKKIFRHSIFLLWILIPVLSLMRLADFTGTNDFLMLFIVLLYSFLLLFLCLFIIQGIWDIVNSRLDE